MPKKPPPGIVNSNDYEISAEEFKKPPAEDRLTQIRKLIAEVRDEQAEAKDLEERLSKLNSRVAEKLSTTIPALMMEAGVDRVDVQAEGNHPAVAAKLKPFFTANIAAGWPEDKRKEGFKELERCKAGDLIRTTVVVAFPREKRADAKAFEAVCIKHGLSPNTMEAVHHGQMAAWLKDRMSKPSLPQPDLEKIGGRAGKVVELKIRED
jgi:hypothetical protein